MNFRKINNITGWVVFLIALATYMFTREARGSLWDCGEFVSSAYKMELPHPPGAPMFTLIGRFFIILFGDNGHTAANAVNFMSAMASAATILFLFWSITHFARKMFVNVGEQLTGQQIFTAMSAGIVGALAYTFSDSFWYSAVEGEVYALSSFFTALVFWAMLKWEHADEHAGNDTVARARADRWIIFLFFMMGCSIGVHLLNLLTIPAVIMIYYFRRYFKYDPFKEDITVVKKDQLLIWDAILTVGLVLLLIIANVLNKENDLMGIALIITLIGTFIAVIRIYLKYKAIRNLISAFIIGCVVVGIVQVGVIQYSMKSAGIFDVFFVNSLNLPFFSGFTVYFLALAAVIVWAFRFNENNITRTKLIIWFILFLVLSALPFIVSLGSVPIQFLKFLLTAGIATLIGYFFKATGLRLLRLSLWCYAFMMLGYFMYFTALIRSNANPAVDMNNVDNPISLVYYLSREQYGSQPILFGPHFDADYELDDASPNGIAMKTGEMKYVKSKDNVTGKDKYIPTGTEDEPTFQSKDIQLFPRVWDKSNDQNHFSFYVQWLDLKPGDDQDQQKGRGQYVPTYADNANWFVTYQLNLMYWRYFMWNFAGKQNDIQGMGNARDGNWISGIPIIDNNRLGDQDKLPASIQHNKAHNKLYMLPFILGILGCVYQFKRNKTDWVVTFLLFFLTGIAVVIYLNQPGNQPRERDYAYVGSFYAFAIWIGLSVIAFVKMAGEKENKKSFREILLYGSILTLLVTLMSSLHGGVAEILFTTLAITALFALVTTIITYLVRAVSSAGQNAGLLNIATTVVCLIVPLIMAQQEWDDHDRSQKTTAPDLAKDYLESCAKNAVLFTFGDNDTYPLWYAQEVEGVRPDIRIINNSLLGIDWYVNQLRYKINDADSLDVIWTPEQIEGHNREYLRYRLKQGADPKAFYLLYDIMKNELGKPLLDPKTHRDVGPDYFPVPRVSVPVDAAFVRSNGTVNSNDAVLPSVDFEIPEGRLRGLQRNDLVILNIIASNNWKRPIYFTSPAGLGFDQYLRKDGLAYRLVPVMPKNAQQNWVFERTIDSLEQNVYRTSLAARQVWDNNDSAMYSNLMNKFEFGGANKKGTYFDEENRRHILNIRSAYGEAAGNLADEGKKDEAKKLLEKADAGILSENMPYGMTSRFNSHNQTGLVFLEACYKAGETAMAEKVRSQVRKDLEDQQKYYSYLKAEKPEFYTGSIEGQEQILNDVAMVVLDAIEKKYAPQAQPQPPVETGNKPIINSPAKGIDSAKKPADTSKKKK
ncbi:MAG: DUF2723 domain-containing protein [Bacteroidota bacterium]|nr:DUF2723 domain-containing protein [Bacteroidota bacterium]